MAKVLTFGKVDTPEMESLIKGEAHCQNCGHEFKTAHPIGTVAFACSRCGKHTATFKFGVEADTTFVCACGCYLFTISPTNLYCWNCGKSPELPA